MSGYLTVATEAVAEIEVKGSRLRCRVVRVDDEAAARAVVDAARREHHDARHHCSAWVVGAPGAGCVERASDDGEPSGTAGAPMLEVLRGAGLHDVVAVVTRWFGGTLLGAGGLVRAYGDAVRATLPAAGTRPRGVLRELELRVGHDVAGRVEGELRQRGVAVLGAVHAAEVTLRLGVEPDAEPALHAVVAEVSGGRSRADLVGERWVDLP